MRDEQRGLVDRRGWDRGPWDDEPDRVEWRHHGLPCLVTRHPDLGNLCGYVAIPKGHPWYGGVPDDVKLRAPGGVTYGNLGCSGNICHVPRPGESDNIFWIGFDCGHAWDLQPGMMAMMGGIAAFAPPGLLKSLFGGEGVSYKKLEYVEAAVNALADQVAAASR